jgi:membrane-bound lytic murein transglycosylase C
VHHVDFLLRLRRRDKPQAGDEQRACACETDDPLPRREAITGTLPAIMRSYCLAVALGACLAACADMDKSLGSAERAIAVVNNPTAKSVTSIAKADDRSAAARELLKKRGDTYAANPQAAINDIRQVERDYERLVGFLTGNVNRTWGKKETKLPTRTHYVKYTQNYMSRAVVDFDASRITVETLDDKNPSASLKSAIVTTLLTPNDPRAVDLYSDQPVTLTSDREPYLKGLVLDQRGREIGSPADAEAFADHLLGRAANRAVTTDASPKNALYVEIAMVANLANKQAEKFRAMVTKAAGQYKVSPSLVFAIIRTESNFNPFAVSSAPAYGLMQLVPTSGGREATRRARGRDGVPTKDELFDADNNIELGTAYLSVLLFNQLQAIGNPVSREYCVISAYNTGPGNVLRTFNRSQGDAVNEINRLEPPAVYEKLRSSLPYAETREYLHKVVGFRRQFVTVGN